jgi:hypothetical protein
VTPRIERVIAVDPGKLTGQAVMERVRTETEHEVRILESAETGPDETVPWFREMYARYWEPAAGGSPRMRVVMESFLLGARTEGKSQEASWALRTQGAVEQACRDLGYPVEAIQFYSADKKKTFPNPRLKRLGLWHVGGKGHALDAIRHATLYLSQTGLVEQTREP